MNIKKNCLGKIDHSELFWKYPANTVSLDCTFKISWELLLLIPHKTLGNKSLNVQAAFVLRLFSSFAVLDKETSLNGSSVDAPATFLNAKVFRLLF